MSQWETELKMLLKPQTFDIFLYGTGKAAHDNFWAEKGPFYSSLLPMAQRIIIASQSVRLFEMPPLVRLTYA